MKKLLLLVFLSFPTFLFAQTKISGTITDADSKPVSGASLVIKGKLIGTTTDENGNFSLNTSAALPLTLVVTGVGYQKQEVAVSTSGESVKIGLTPQTELLNEMVVTASRVEESILESPVSIEKMDTRAIRETPSINFYDGLQNIKSVEMVTSGLTFKQINTRGFNGTGNSRFLQLVDGVDNQTPGLNFAVGNLFGSSDLDMESAELIPGSASALYGPVAFNGVLMMRTKDPFQYQGLSAQVRVGVNHINEQYADPHGLYDYALRYAKAFNNRFAFKINASYFTGLDWYATNYTDVDAGATPEQRGDNNPARNGLNIYGDDDVRTLTGVGRVSRTGYEERFLMNYNSYSTKLNGALHYRLTDNMELIYQYNYNQGRAAYTGSNRFMLNDFNFQQHRVELKGSNYFIRGYANLEDSKNSYNGKGLGQLINKTWVRDLNGNVVSEAQADDTWYARYQAAFTGNVNNVTAADHAAARAFADQGRFLPGSTEFEDQKARLIAKQGSGGAGILSQSKLYHAEGQYDFSDKIKVLDVLVGGNFRMYDMFTNGTLFDDKNNKITIKEGGAFAQASKRLLNEKLKLTASLRYDKNQNFDGRFTPRASAVYTVATNHHFRTSFQTGFRNPTPGDQYIKLDAGVITVLGGVPDNSRGMTVYQNSVTTPSLGAFQAAFMQAMAGGASPQDAVMQTKDIIQKSNVAYIKPERVQTFEIGYKGLVNNNLLIDANYYFSSYNDFILNQVVMEMQSPVLGPDGKINPAIVGDLQNGKTRLYQLYTNASDRVTSQGATLGLTYLLPGNYTVGANGTWADFNLRNANVNDIPAFNTPKYRTTVTFGNSAIAKNFGFNVAWRWQDTFEWTSTFNGMRPGTIKAYSIVDAQVSYKMSPIKSIVKFGANNVFNNQVYQAYGSPSIGAVYYVSIVFDQLMK
ncbi:TonB-dependent receptor [Chryseolinea lacunae]|uniref:TonB-dependent receptor n=1 Tax=Chryseolinea lacunae TaxID=2801331 RepID=A0ABS1KVT3_9BACT|nr:TonB-dependent receptor [Chryseolinea lacunae]MBL0743479.1 TonB-dependent receptor [Chryseolinea lacunae]